MTRYYERMDDDAFVQSVEINGALLWGQYCYYGEHPIETLRRAAEWLGSRVFASFQSGNSPVHSAMLNPGLPAKPERPTEV